MNVRVRYLDRDGVEHDEVRRGLTAGTFQHEVDHLDGILFVDRVRDPATFTTWEQFERHHRDAFVDARERWSSASARDRRGRRPAAQATGARRRLWCELAWLGGERAEAGVLIEVDGDRLVAVTPGAEPPEDGERLAGLTLPGLANAHSHAFQRALRGRTQAGTGTFWTWREQMYELAERLDPDTCFAISRAAFGEMALAGITCVGEFHYVHHARGGVPYEDPNAMGRAVIAAAEEAGIRITLLDACYLHGGIQRFRDPDADLRGPPAWTRCTGRRRSGSARRSTACARSTRRRRGRSPSGPPSSPAARRCTPTSPSSPPRTRSAWPRTAARRRRCSRTPARCRPSSPPCTRRT